MTVHNVDPGLACHYSHKKQILPPTPNAKVTRGRPKQLSTQGHACPNPNCDYFGVSDDQLHALVGDGKRGLLNHIQYWRCQSCRASFSSRLGRHHIVDPFLRFYYRFLSQRQRQLSVGVKDKALAEMKRHLRDFIGAHTWEELCREWLLRFYEDDRLPFLPDQVGGRLDPKNPGGRRRLQPDGKNAHFGRM